LTGVGRSEEVLLDNQKRVLDLTAQLENLSGRVEDRMAQLESLRADVDRLSSLKTEWQREITALDGRQLEARANLESSQALLRGTTELFGALERRRGEIESIEERLVDQMDEKATYLNAAIAELDRQTGYVESRQSVVDAIRVSMAELNASTDRTRDDVRRLMEAGQDISTTRGQLDTLVSQTGDLDGRMRQLEARRPWIEEAEIKIQHLNNLAQDISVSLETFREQKTMVDQVAARLAQLDFATKHAEAVTLALQEERELSERVAEGIQALRGTRRKRTTVTPVN